MDGKRNDLLEAGKKQLEKFKQRKTQKNTGKSQNASSRGSSTVDQGAAAAASAESESQQEQEQQPEALRSPDEETVSLGGERWQMLTQHEDCGAKIKDLQGQLEIGREELRNSQEQVQALRLEMEECKRRSEEEMGAHSMDRAALEAEAAGLRSRVAELSSGLEAERNILLERVSEVSSDRAALEAERNILLERVSEVCSDRVTLQAEVAGLRSRVAEMSSGLEAEKSSGSEVRASLEAEVTGLRSRIAEMSSGLKAEKSVASEMKAGFEAEVAGLRSRLTEMEAERSVADEMRTAEAADLRFRVAELTSDLEAEKNVASSDRTALEAEAAGLRSRVTELSSGLEDERNVLSDRLSELSSAQDRLRLLESENQRHTQLVAELRTKLKKAGEGLEAEKDARVSELSSAQDRLRVLEAENQHQRDLVAELQTDLKEVREVRAQNNDLQQRVADLMVQREQFEAAARESSRDQNAELHRRVSELEVAEDRLRLLEPENERHKERAAELETYLKEARDAEMSSRARNVELQRTLEVVQAEIQEKASAEPEVKDRDDTNGLLLAAVSRLEGSAVSLAERAVSSMAANAESMVENARNMGLRLETELGLLEKGVGEEVELLRTQVSELRSSLDAEQQRFGEIKERLEAEHQRFGEITERLEAEQRRSVEINERLEAEQRRSVEKDGAIRQHEEEAAVAQRKMQEQMEVLGQQVEAEQQLIVEKDGVIQEMKEHAAVMQSEIQDMEQEMGELRGRLEAEQRTSVEKDGVFREQKEHAALLQLKIQEIEQEMSDLRGGIEAEQLKTAEAIRRNEEQAFRVATLVFGEVEDAETTADVYSRLETGVLRVLSKLKAAVDRSTVLAGEASAFAAQLEQLQHSNELLQEELRSKLREGDERLEEAGARFQQEIQGLREELAASRETVASLSQEQEVLQEKLEAAIKEQSKLQLELSESEQKLGSVRDKLGLAVKKGKGLVQHRDELKQLLAEKGAEVESAVEKSRVLEMALGKARSEAEMEAAGRRSAEETVSSLQVEIDACRSSITEMKGNASGLAARVKELTRRLSETYEEKQLVERSSREALQQALGELDVKTESEVKLREELRLAEVLRRTLEQERSDYETRLRGVHELLKESFDQKMAAFSGLSVLASEVLEVIVGERSSIHSHSSSFELEDVGTANKKGVELIRERHEREHSATLNQAAAVHRVLAEAVEQLAPLKHNSVAALTSRLEAKEQESVSLRLQLSAKCEELQSAVTKANTLEGEASQRLKELEQLRIENDATTESMESLRRQLSAKDEELKTAVTKVEAELSRRLEELEQLRMENDAKSGSMESSNSKAVKLASSLRKLQQQSEEMLLEMEKLHTTNLGLEQQLESIRIFSENLHGRNLELEKQLENSRISSENLHGRNLEIEQQLENSRISSENLHGRNLELEQQLENSRISSEKFGNRLLSLLQMVPQAAAPQTSEPLVLVGVLESYFQRLLGENSAIFAAIKSKDMQIHDLEQKLNEKTTLQFRAVESTARSSMEIEEEQPTMYTKTAHLRSQRRPSADHVVVDILEEEKGHGLKPLSSVRAFPRRLGEQIDGLSLNVGKFLGRQPMGRLCVIVYCIGLHLWMLMTMISLA